MKSLCILSGCPAGARKGRISIFAVLLHSKKQNDPEGSFSVYRKASQSFASADAKYNGNPLYPAAPPTGTILLASQVWKFALWGNLMRAVEAHLFCPKSDRFLDSLSAIRSAGWRLVYRIL